jgi:hypothetical protein
MRKAIVRIGGLVAVASTALTLAVVSPSFASPAAKPATASHTLKFTSVEKGSVNLSKTMFAQQDTDVNSAGKVIGYDDLYLATTSAKTADGWVTLDVDGGFLYGTFKLNLVTGAITDGKVTGGARAFKGATGTLTATSVSSTKTAVKLTYRT